MFEIKQKTLRRKAGNHLNKRISYQIEYQNYIQVFGKVKYSPNIPIAEP